jgi:membrane associated rhomboid family serine protease
MSSPNPIQDIVTNGTAVGALSYPIWPELMALSGAAGAWLPILGAIWLLTQIIHKWYPVFSGWCGKKKNGR